MTDNGDNTYTYSTTVARPGDITVNVLKYTLGVYNEYFTSTDYSGTVAKQNISSDINFNWGTGDIFTGARDGSANFYFRLLAPVTGVYYFYLSHDDNAELWINNNNILNVG
jgi:hypothetical protein